MEGCAHREENLATDKQREREKHWEWDRKKEKSKRWNWIEKGNSWESDGKMKMREECESQIKWKWEMDDN